MLKRSVAVLFVLFAVLIGRSRADTTIAVLPFSASGQAASDSGKGLAIAEHISSFLGQCEYVTIVERSQVDKVMGEIGLSQTGVMEEGKELDAGKLIGATHLVVGSYAAEGRGLKISARIVETESGEVKGSAIEEGGDESKVMDAVSVKLLRAMGIASTYDRSYTVKRVLGFSALGLCAGGAGLAAWTHVTYKDADEEYTTRYNLTRSEYKELRDRAELHMNARVWFAGGSAVALGGALYLLLSNRTEWEFDREGSTVGLTPVLGPGHAGVMVTRRF